MRQLQQLAGDLLGNASINFPQGKRIDEGAAVDFNADGKRWGGVMIQISHDAPPLQVYCGQNAPQVAASGAFAFARLGFEHNVSISKNKNKIKKNTLQNQLINHAFR